MSDNAANDDVFERIRRLIPLDDKPLPPEQAAEAALDVAKDDGGVPDPQALQKQQQEERRGQADRHIASFVSGTLARAEDGPLSDRFVKRKSLDDLPEDVREKIGPIREQMRERWNTLESRVRVQQTNDPKFAQKAHEHVWSVYVRDFRPKTIDDMIDLYLMAAGAYDAVANKVDEGAYFGYLFRKIAPLLSELRDEHDNTLMHYVLAIDGGNAQRIQYGAEELARNAIERRRVGGGDGQAKDDRQVIRDIFEEDRNEVGETVMALVERFGQKKVVKGVRAALDGLEADQIRTGEAIDLTDLTLQRCVAEQEKAFHPDLLDAMVKNADPHASALYVRMFAEDVTPEELDKLADDAGIDLFKLEIDDGPDAPIRGITRKVTHTHGALANVYAKNGIFNIEYARRKLIKEDGQRQQGRRDERGYNNYMQMCTRADVPSAFMANEHEFWENIFIRIGTHEKRSTESPVPLEVLIVNAARDILDMPGNDGRTALHLACISGNVEAVRFIVAKVVDFTRAEGYRQAIEDRAKGNVLLDARKAYLGEMRTNLGYLTGVDDGFMNPWMHALSNGRTDVLQAMVGRLEKFPEYLEIIALLPVHPPGEGAMSMLEFTSRTEREKDSVTETTRYLRGILRDAESRTKLRKEAGRNIAKQGLV